MDLLLFNKIFNFGNYNRITENIWLSNAFYESAFIEKNGIEIVINCTTDLPFKCKTTENIRIPLKSTDVITEEQYDYVNKIFARNRPTLIHCYHGFMRSAKFVQRYTKLRRVKKICA